MSSKKISTTKRVITFFAACAMLTTAAVPVYAGGPYNTEEECIEDAHKNGLIIAGLAGQLKRIKGDAAERFSKPWANKAPATTFPKGHEWQRHSVYWDQEWTLTPKAVALLQNVVPPPQTHAGLLLCETLARILLMHKLAVAANSQHQTRFDSFAVELRAAAAEIAGTALFGSNDIQLIDRVADFISSATNPANSPSAPPGSGCSFSAAGPSAATSSCFSSPESAPASSWFVGSSSSFASPPMSSCMPSSSAAASASCCYAPTPTASSVSEGTREWANEFKEEVDRFCALVRECVVIPDLGSDPSLRDGGVCPGLGGLPHLLQSRPRLLLMRLFPAFSTVYIPEKTYTGHGGLLQQAAIRLLTLAATKYEDRLTKPDFLAVGADLTAAGARVEEQRGVVMAARTASPDDKKDLDLDFVVVAVHFLSSRGDLVTKFANSIREDNVKVVFAPAAAAASDSDWLCGSACASGCGAGSGAGAGEGSGLFEAEREEQERIDRARLESEKKREEGYKKVAAACAEQEKKKEEIARLRKQHDDLEREIADQQKKQYRLAEEDGQRDEQLEKIEEEIEKLEAEEQALAAKLERDEILASQSTSLQKHNEASIDTAEKMRYGGPSSSAAAAAAAHTSLDADSQGILAKLQSNYSVIDSLLEQLRGAQSAENGERTAEKARVTTQLEALRAEQKALRENYERHLQEKEKLEQEKQELQEKRARVEREIEKLEEECTVIDKTVGIGALQTLKYTE